MLSACAVSGDAEGAGASAWSSPCGTASGTHPSVPSLERTHLEWPPASFVSSMISTTSPTWRVENSSPPGARSTAAVCRQTRRSRSSEPSSDSERPCATPAPPLPADTSNSAASDEERPPGSPSPLPSSACGRASRNPARSSAEARSAWQPSLANSAGASWPRDRNIEDSANFCMHCKSPDLSEPTSGEATTSAALTSLSRASRRAGTSDSSCFITKLVSFSCTSLLRRCKWI
mmetsp:Transcript_12664/g.35586  ORF Transcript_12664/g.35586 Transcript_12664/m.35586 type:complete len:233 (-) Transcript_12664:2205-2903(-)